jgi:DNA polymerase alpha subunit B
LEGSRHRSGGARVEVDLSYLHAQNQSYSLFPGQIVAVGGMNCSGRKLVAHRICEGAPHAPVKSTVSDLIKFHHGDDFQGGTPLQIVAASGPFTILMGPFVDMRHKAVASGQTILVLEHENGEEGEEILAPYEDLFSNTISSLLEELYGAGDSIQTQFVLVTSLDDATVEWVYPQPPFADRGGTNLNISGAAEVELGTMGLHHIETVGRGGVEGGRRRVHCVSNPCTLKINEVVVGVTVTDVLFHISADETNSNLEAGSRMGRIAQHMLSNAATTHSFLGRQIRTWISSTWFNGKCRAHPLC